MPPHPAIQLIQNDPERFAAQGAVIATWRTHRGRRLGPYYRLTWRENRRQRSLYLGRDGPIVDHVRTLLHEAQEIRRLKKEHRQNQEIFRRTVIEPLENYVKEIFYLYSDGLYLKGWEVRGFSTGGSFRTDAKVPAHLIPKFPLPLPEALAQIHNQAVANLAREREHQTPSPISDPSLEIPQSVTQKPKQSSTTDSSAVDNAPLERLISEIVSDFASRISDFPKQENPTDRATPTHASDHQPPSPISDPSLEIPQSVTQKPKQSSTTDSPAVDNAPLAHLISEIVSDFASRISDFPKQENPTDRATPTHASDLQTPSPISDPSLEIPQSVTQKPSNPTRRRRRQTSSANAPRSTAFPAAVHNTPLGHSNFRFVSDFAFRISYFPHAPRAPPIFPPSRKKHPKTLSP